MNNSRLQEILQKIEALKQDISEFDEYLAETINDVKTENLAPNEGCTTSNDVCRNDACAHSANGTCTDSSGGKLS